ncbi:MAG: tetratricopeptide repeat protein, partial [bacterium]|nr:tetratricopeptide repeat protein [bacterium]
LTWANAAEKARARLEALQKKPVRRFQNRSVDSPDLSAQISEMPRSGAFHELGVEDAQGRSEQVDLVVLPGEGKQVASTRSLERFSGCGFRELTVGIGVEGPAAALNGVLGDVQGTYLALVRSDVVGTEDWLARLVEHMEARPELAMLAPCLPEGAGEQRVKARYRSLKKELQKFARGQHQRQKGEVHPVDVLSPTCVLIRTSVLGSLGGVDASFRSPAFVLDLARRCRQQGGIVACAMDTFVHCDLVEMGEVETREGEAVGHLEAGDVHRAAGEHEASIVCYRSALEAKPDYMEVVLVLSSALLEAGRGKEAVGLFREMESRHPDSSRVKNYLGRCLFQAGEVADARRCFEMAIEIDDTFSEAYSNLGVLLWEAGELDGALARLKRAAELTPQHPDVVYNIAMIYAQLGQARQAIRMLQSYLDLQGDDLNARVYLAVLLLENEAEADGLTQLEYVMEREPEHEEALKVVAKLREGMDEGESDTTQAEE